MASEVELLEVFRLAETARLGDVVRGVGERLAGRWLGVSRFRDVAGLTARSQRIQTSPRTLVYAGRASATLGDLDTALRHYEQALSIRRKFGDRAGEAATLSNIGAPSTTAAATATLLCATTSRPSRSCGRSATAAAKPRP